MDGEFHAFKNRCPHWGGRLDPVTDSAAVRCCNMSGSTFDYTGNIMSGFGNGRLETYRVEMEKCKLIIRLD
jgi:nitrite reductase/ring-hydroxylating ferredoxin subunit